MVVVWRGADVDDTIMKSSDDYKSAGDDTVVKLWMPVVSVL